MLTAKEVRREVRKLRAMAGDDEAAHGREDDLYLMVLTSIASGECADPRACAREVIKTQHIKFGRYTA